MNLALCIFSFTACLGSRAVVLFWYVLQIFVRGEAAHGFAYRLFVPGVWLGSISGLKFEGFRDGLLAAVFGNARLEWWR
jgi:hypothetical protein